MQPIDLNVYLALFCPQIWIQADVLHSEWLSYLLHLFQHNGSVAIFIEGLSTNRHVDLLLMFTYICSQG